VGEVEYRGRKIRVVDWLHLAALSLVSWLLDQLKGRMGLFIFIRKLLYQKFPGFVSVPRERPQMQVSMN